ncbi:MAG: transcription antitermination factor NusB [Thermaerobacterales bacterium]
MKRRQARIVALTVLYQWDLVGQDLDTALAAALSESGLGGARDYAGDLVTGVRRTLPEIDARLGESAIDWRVERMSTIDRNLLRLGSYELSDRREIPTSVVINEAVELAKSFSTPEAARFINGILGRVARAVRDPAAKV